MVLATDDPVDGIDEDIQFLTGFGLNYADDEARRECGKHYGRPIPEHLEPPYDRDRLLPGH